MNNINKLGFRSVKVWIKIKIIDGKQNLALFV